jgi:LmbE family N-acetylglucosaminyl deacetylase
MNAEMVGVSDMKSVLAVGAHPDDIELGCAATLALHKLKGDKVYCLVLTRGEASGSPELRSDECKRSLEILGADGLFFGDIGDTKVGDGRETIDAIEKVVDTVNPDIVYAPTLKDTHQDHRNAGHATLSACRRCKIILMYEGASTQRDFTPQVFVDVKNTFELKMKMTHIFGSQVRNHGVYSVAMKAIEGLAKFRGYQAGVDVAEAFEVGKFIFEV